MQTCSRPQGSTLHSALRSLANADTWFGSRLLIVDGNYQPKIDGWNLANTQEETGSRNAFLFLLQETVDRWPCMTSLTILQDDIVICEGALDYISRVNTPDDVALISYHSEVWPVMSRPVPSLGIFKGYSFFGAQCVTLSRRTTEALLVHGSLWEGRHGCDVLVAKVLSKQDWYYAIHSPSLVQHEGSLNSACGHSHFGERRSPSFPGVNSDARRWLP